MRNGKIFSWKKIGEPINSIRRNLLCFNSQLTIEYIVSSSFRQMNDIIEEYM